ncbi:TCP-1/cpn60 chaperonin family protein [Chlamydia pneumoniae LPCoLN]|uniref:variant chaperonin GroEL3 n=1 Tax=Chlamydia pneumoniae TaxID=83558 RepID=UPI0001BD9C43|nr:variant chaperonin GroEL3 [Chlamydia pneumoniae]ACZ32787.1 TCP-1/cpn60 chaperonin family protein [Chlamydia pneumoniae LPCoLN]
MSEQEKLSNYNADKKLFSGIDKLFQIVKGSYGPKQSLSPTSFFKERGFYAISQTELSNSYENLGVDFAKAMVNKIHKEHSDGATTGLILLHAILQESYAALEKGISTHKLIASLKLQGEKLQEALQQQSWPIKDALKVRNIIFSSLHMPTIADHFYNAFSVVGPEGLISITKERENEKTSMDVFQGFKIPAGYASTYFVSDTASRLTRIAHPLILITDRKISMIHSLLPLLQEISEQNQHLIIFCEDIDPDALATLVVNKLQGLLQVTVVTIPQLSTTNQELAEDIALFTGTHICPCQEASHVLAPEMVTLGSCLSIEISESQTTLIGGLHIPEVLTLKTRQLAEEIRTTSCLETKKRLIKRTNRLQSSVAILPTDEDNEPLYTLALKIMESALSRGYVPGGGVALFYASLTLGTPKDDADENSIAISLLQKACCAPLKLLATNADLDGDAVIAKLSSLGTTSLGISVFSREIEDLIAGGILDSLATTSTILAQALDTAILVLSSKILILENQYEISTL